MNDSELAKYLNLTPEEAVIVLPKLTLKRRALYDRMADVAVEAELWAAGLGPKPTGVLLDFDRRRKGE